jgi:hypothetical protein
MNTSRHRRLPTPAERRERIAELQNATPDLLAKCRMIVQKWVPTWLADPDDCLGDALEIALCKYDGRSQPAYFVGLVARRIAFRKWERSQRMTSLEEIEEDDRRFARSDPEPSESVDPELIQAIEDNLNGLIGRNRAQRQTKWRRPPEIALARQALHTLAESANRDAGLGIDEYDNAPICKPDWTGQYTVRRSTRQGYANVVRDASATFGASWQRTSYAFTALRNAAKQAIAERKAAQ